MTSETKEYSTDSSEATGDTGRALVATWLQAKVPYLRTDASSRSVLGTDPVMEGRIRTPTWILRRPRSLGTAVKLSRMA